MGGNVLQLESERCREEGIAKGREEGIVQGIAKGRMEGRAEVARNMLQESEPVDKIARYSGLSILEIQKLKEKMTRESVHRHGQPDQANR